MKAAFDLSLLLITHDLGVVAETADRVAVMYAGRIVEDGAGARDLPRTRSIPYTRGLLASMPGGAPGERLRAIEGTVPLLGDAAAGLRVQPALPRSLRAVHRRRRRRTTPSAPTTRRKCYLHDPQPRRPADRIPAAVEPS